MLPETVTLSDVLEEHLAVLAEVEEVIHEENSLLKHTGQPPDDAFIRRKSLLLPRLDKSLSALRERSTNGTGLSAPVRGLMREAQRKLHKVLLLDRENESLLMRCTLHNGGLPTAGSVKVGASQMERTYGRHAA
jgi:flagellar biosynthesis/type III secretory pathway chaperone